jgi:hypothetical protein
MVAVVSMLAACMLALFSDRAVTEYWTLALPIAVQEITLAAWLLVKGLDGSALGAGSRGAATDPHMAPESAIDISV